MNFIGLVNLFSGGAMLQLSIFALGVMPYITASIVIQLLRVVIPRFEALHKEGQSGEAKLTQYTRYLTIGLALLQSSTIVLTKIMMASSTPVTMPNLVQSPSVPLVPQPMFHSCGRKPEQMERKMRIDMPWPMPFSVMSSAIHMIRPVPPVMTSTMTIRVHTSSFGM